MESITLYSQKKNKHQKLLFIKFYLYSGRLSKKKTGIRVPSNRDEESLDITPRGEELTALTRQYT